MTQSALSIVVPAYNVLSYLERCVGSLLESTVQDIDVIVVDDGSTDGTGRLCDDLARSDPRVSVVHQPNGGLSAARNTGLTAAQGRYVMFLDADDWAEPTMAAEMIAAADASGAEVVMAGCVVDFEDDKYTHLRRRRWLLDLA